jgi:Mrp family chromosome partitioning ATPase
VRVKDFDVAPEQDLAAWLELSRSVAPAARRGSRAFAPPARRSSFFSFRRLPKPASYERIRLTMLAKWLPKAQDGCTVIAFTARTRGEGVSTVVAGLACAFGAADPGEVLVLDVSGSKRSVSRLLGVKAGAAPHAGAADLPQWITRADGHGIDIFALADAGGLRWDSPRLAEAVLARLRPNYRTILIDAGSLGAGWAACWLRGASYRVLVVDATLATQEILEHQRNELERSGIALDGSILNKRTYHIPRLFYWLTR